MWSVTDPERNFFKNLTRANEGCVTFGNEIVVQNRKCAWISEKGVGSVVRERNRKAAVCNDKFDGVEHS